MFDCLTHPLTFPKYSFVKCLEGKGNYAVRKYYVYPWRYFYRHKVRMIERLLRGRHFNKILDFGSGSGVLIDQWKKFANNIHTADKGYTNLPKVDMTICASVMEFVNLHYTFEELSKKTDEIIVASPMCTDLSAMYFDLIRDTNIRNCHDDIMDAMAKHFEIKDYKEWLGLYFCARGVKR